MHSPGAPCTPAWRRRPSSFDDVAEQAQLQARQPYRSSSRKAPAELQALNYDQYRDIRFRPDRALWRSGQSAVRADVLSPRQVPERAGAHQRGHAAGHAARPLPAGDFDYGKNKLSPQSWGDLGFAGFRAHYPLNSGEYKDEVVVFLGASYFRALGAGQHYGLSARGLAIDTVGGQGEEFPRSPSSGSSSRPPMQRRSRIYALLDSPRATGAYQFDVRPGGETVMDVRARIFLRASVATLGIAPLTSMFAFGENQPHRTDFRPEVHDSDGLMVATGDGEWIWRPLLNPKQTLTTSFSMKTLRGFGLMQRDRDFRSYEDSEARYELRPSAWVEPVGTWGPGRVELVQLNTPDETNDNIVAYWVPASCRRQASRWTSRIGCTGRAQQEQHPPGAWVVQTRVGRGFAELAEDEQQFVVDFTGPSLAGLPPDATVKAVVSAPANGEIVESNAYRVEATGDWRMTVRVKQLNRNEPTELRGFLQNGNDVLTETWSNILPPLLQR